MFLHSCLHISVVKTPFFKQYAPLVVLHFLISTALLLSGTGDSLHVQNWCRSVFLKTFQMFSGNDLCESQQTCGDTELRLLSVYQVVSIPKPTSLRFPVEPHSAGPCLISELELIIADSPHCPLQGLLTLRNSATDKWNDLNNFAMTASSNFIKTGWNFSVFFNWLWQDEVKNAWCSPSGSLEVLPPSSGGTVPVPLNPQMFEREFQSAP